MTLPMTPEILARLREGRRQCRVSSSAYLAEPSRETAETMEAAHVRYLDQLAPFLILELRAILEFLAAEDAFPEAPPRPIVCGTPGCYQPATHISRPLDGRRVACDRCTTPGLDWVTLDEAKGHDGDHGEQRDGQK